MGCEIVSKCDADQAMEFMAQKLAEDIDNEFRRDDLAMLSGAEIERLVDIAMRSFFGKRVQPVSGKDAS